MRTYLLDQPPGDGVVRVPLPLPILHRQLPVDLAYVAEYRAAELHATLDDTSAVLAGDPARSLWRECLRRCRSRVRERDLVEAETDLGVCSRGELVKGAEEGDVRGGERGVGVEALEEDNCGG